MASATDMRPSIRVIAYNAANAGIIPTRNIVTSQQTTGIERYKECVQLTAAQALAGIHKTVMAAASVTAGLPSLYIAGYSAPS